MFGAPKISANLSISRILEIASNLNGKPNLFDQLFPLTETSEKRYQLAKRYQRHRIVIDVLYYYSFSDKKLNLEILYFLNCRF
jgi:hypothetical protein